MKKKRKRSQRGSITVFVTAILIPTILVTALLTDLARIKLYSNQALMAADNYGEAVLTQYDNLLKELYGLFAVSQNEEAMEAVETMQEYMKTSFDPTKDSVQFQHLQGTILNQGSSYDGFMPYRSAELELSYEAASDDANLSNTDVLSTQIGDFMRYRIVQNLVDGGEWLVDAMEEVQHSQADTDVMAEKEKRDEQLNKALSAMQKYYEQLCEMDEYKEYYLKGLNKNFQNAKTEIKELVQSERYKEYIEAAKASETTEENAEEITEEERGEQEENPLDLRAEGKYFNDEFDKIIEKYSDCYNDGSVHGIYKVTFQNYTTSASSLVVKAVKVGDELDKVKEEQIKLEAKLNDEDVSEDLRKGVKEESSKLNELLESSVSNTYVALAKVFQNSTNTSCLSEFSQTAEEIEESLANAKDYYLRYYDGTQDQYSDNDRITYAQEIKISSYDDFKNHSEYKGLYEKLKKTFSTSEDSGVEKKAKNDKKKGEGKTEEKRKALENEEEETEAKNIPENIPIGDDQKAKMLKGGDMLQSAASLMNGSLSEAKNELLLKLYTVNYDMNMFSSRVTNISTDGNREVKESLTGYEMCEGINYLYQAELEYLYGGHKSSKENLRETRNTIILFRTAVNLASTYRIKEVNNAIKTITEACSAINPILGLAAAAALRLGVASIETYQDWKLLKEGKSVTLVKTKVKELNSFEEIKELLPGLNKDDTKDSTQGQTGTGTKSLKLNYEQYLLVLLVVFTPRETIASRTGDLICLNVNNVKQGGGDLKSLEFQMENALTAVKASCSVHLDYVVMPDGFARATVDDDVYTAMQEFEKNKYKYSVIRGY